MRYEAIKKASTQWVRIRPALQTYNDSAVLMNTIEDAWLVSDITNDSLRLSSRDTQHFKIIGLDHIHSYMDDPASQLAGGTTGVLVMNVQLLFFEGELHVEPVAPPGTPLKVFVPARPRATLIDAASRMRAQAEFKKASREFAWSNEGVQSSDQAFSGFKTAFYAIEVALRAAGEPIQMVTQENQNTLVLGAAGWWVSIVWQRRYGNTLDDSRLTVTKWDGHPGGIRGITIWERPNKISTESYTYGLAALNQPRWLSLSNSEQSYTTLDLAERILTQLLEHPNSR